MCDGIFAQISVYTVLKKAVMEIFTIFAAHLNTVTLISFEYPRYY
jgi:hypothetical protein